MPLNHISIIKRYGLKLLRVLNPGDIRIRHHYTKAPFHLHSFTHRSYWFRGKSRERDIMKFFAKIIDPGNEVVDVGGHIGYLSMYFAQLTGKHGRVFVIEPGPQNLVYLKRNCAFYPNIDICDKGISNARCRRVFYTESTTGQNCSFNSEYTRQRNEGRSYLGDSRICETELDVLTLDEFVSEKHTSPDVIKLDVETHEWEVLEGATRVITELAPVFMVEVRVHHEDIFRRLGSAGYIMVRPSGAVCRAGTDIFKDCFAFHREKHAALLDKVGISVA